MNEQQMEAMLREIRDDIRQLRKQSGDTTLALELLKQRVENQDDWQNKASGVAFKAVGVLVFVVFMAVMTLIFPGGLDK